MFIATKKPSNFFTFAILITSDINFWLSLMCLFLKYVDCYEEIKYDKIFFSLFERAFEITFRSTFNKEMGL